MGFFVIMLNSTCFIIQIMLLKKDFPKKWLLQLPATIIFGWMTDLCCMMVYHIELDSYWMQTGSVLIGIVLIAFGFSMETASETIFLPADGIIKVIAMSKGYDFGRTKVLFDVTLVCLSILASLALFKGVVGVREGTVLNALLVGTLSRRFLPLINKRINKSLDEK